MKKILSVALVAGLALALAAPVSAGGFHGGGGRGGGRGGIPSRRISRRLPSLRLLFRPRLRRGGLRWLGARLPVLCLSLRLSLWLSLRGVPGLPGPCLRPGAGLPVADAGLCFSLSPPARVLHRRLVPPPPRWADR